MTLKQIRAAAILAVLFCGCVLMGVVDGVISPPYEAKSAVKIVAFGIVPTVLLISFDKNSFVKLLKPEKKGILISLFCGCALYAIILGGYFLLRNIFDFSAITDSLVSGEGVTKEKFPYVALYISIFNSFLEEFFFRGFAFLGLKELLGRKAAHTVSALMFALYHVAIMSGWFSPILFALLLLGLYAGGVIFNAIDEKSGCIYSSWLLHAFANLAINTVGMILFGII